MSLRRVLRIRDGSLTAAQPTGGPLTYPPSQTQVVRVQPRPPNPPKTRLSQLAEAEKKPNLSV